MNDRKMSKMVNENDDDDVVVDYDDDDDANDDDANADHPMRCRRYHHPWFFHDRFLCRSYLLEDFSLLQQEILSRKIMMITPIIVQI